MRFLVRPGGQVMARTFLAAVLLAAFAGIGDPSAPARPAPPPAESEPDPSRSVPLDRWPNDADLTRLRSAEGKPKATVLRVLGHPSRVERRPDGAEVWHYPWCASCRVWIRKGVCTGTFYTSGY
jgi:hypothetical protein